MILNEGDIKNANLEFFNAIFLNTEDLSSETLRQAPVLHSIGIIEAALWLRLGIELDFFEAGNVVQQLISIEDGLSAAWTILQEETLISKEWCDFLTPVAGGRPIFIKEQYLRVRDEPSEMSAHRDFLKQSFLSHLLLTSEVIFEPSTMFFLESVNRSPDEAWQRRLKGFEETSIPFDSLYLGFANYVQYIHRFVRFAHQPLNHEGDFGVIPEASVYALEDLTWRISEMVRPRTFIDMRATQRCFEFGGDLLATIKQSGPEWLEMRAVVFDQLDFVAHWSNRREMDVGQRRHMWDVFVAHSNGSDTGPVEPREFYRRTREETERLIFDLDQAIRARTRKVPHQGESAENK
jgi:hypothetical protein